MVSETLGLYCSGNPQIIGHPLLINVCSGNPGQKLFWKPCLDIGKESLAKLVPKTLGCYCPGIPF